MRVAWVTHHVPRPDDAPAEPGLFSGRFAGGAEMSDAEYVAAAPAGVDVVVVPASEWEAAADADLVVITGFEGLSDEACAVLAAREPAVLIHHAQDRRRGVHDVLTGSRVLVVHTPAHEALERSWVSPRRVEHVLSPINTDDCRVGEKQAYAVWAQRWHPLKGPLAAKFWAAKQGVELRMLTDRPRPEVLEAMSTARWWVHLPMRFESESRATIEAVLSGCEPVVNDYVGLTSVDGWQDPGRLAELVTGAGARLWEVFLDA